MDLAPVRVRFRDLADAEIESYLRAETPYDCAGSAKSEGLGIALLESIENDDPDGPGRPAADPHRAPAARRRSALAASGRRLT